MKNSSGEVVPVYRAGLRFQVLTGDGRVILRHRGMADAPAEREPGSF